MVANKPGWFSPAVANISRASRPVPRGTICCCDVARQAKARSSLRLPWHTTSPGRPERRSHLLNAETPASGDRKSRHSDCHDRESRAALAIDPKRGTPLFAELPTLLSETALSQRAGFPGSRAGLRKRHGAFEIRLFGRRRNLHTHMLDSWRFKNFRQPEDGPRPCREFIYFATVLAETVKPSLADSAWIRF